MSLFRNLDWDDWFYGMWVAVATGASGSVLAGLFVNTVVPNVSKSQFWTLLGGFFVLGAAKDFFLYINKNPAPKRTQIDTSIKKEPGGATTMEQKVQITEAIPGPKKEDPKKEGNG